MKSERGVSEVMRWFELKWEEKTANSGTNE